MTVKYIYDEGSEEIVELFPNGKTGGVTYDSWSLEDMSTPARIRLADLQTEDDSRDWLACWRILAAEGLCPGPTDGWGEGE